MLQKTATKGIFKQLCTYADRVHYTFAKAITGIL